MAKARALKRNELIKRLDRLTSIVVRYGSATERNGVLGNVCVSTGKWFPIDKIDAGHFVQRGCLPLRFDRVNVNPESIGANRFGTDHLVGYAETLVKIHGEPILTYLMDIKRAWQAGKIRISTQELRELYDVVLPEAREVAENIKNKYGIKINIPKSW